MERHRLAVVIPAFNEEDTIGSVVKSVKPYGDPIVVDDCSTDLTKKIAEENGAIVVNHEKNSGYDNTLNSGIERAISLGYRYAITFDADGQHEPEFLKKYLDFLEGGYDLVTGIRPEYPRFSEQIYAIYTKLRYGWKDPLCGMKGYNLDLIKKRGYFSSYQSIGTEFTRYCFRKKFKVMQIPIPIYNRQDENPRFGRKLRANYKIIASIFQGAFIRSGK
ncbi:MAG: glycosyltransferase family 2 protein [Leptospiraceae bacterium]|nr:glycosyltransferase family 2 protein [Leptospiraceae bacterium]